MKRSRNLSDYSPRIYHAVEIDSSDCWVNQSADLDLADEAAWEDTSLFVASGLMGFGEDRGFENLVAECNVPDIVAAWSDGEDSHYSE